MSENVLSKDEVDALVKGIEEGDVNTAGGVGEPGSVVPVDFISKGVILRGQFPGLGTLHERFAELLRPVLMDWLKTKVEVIFEKPQLFQFQDFIEARETPTSFTYARAGNLSSYTFFVVDGPLIDALLEGFFSGGKGYSKRTFDKTFSSTERRVINLLLEHCFGGLKSVWSPVFPMEFVIEGQESNPHMVNQLKADETVFVMDFKVEAEVGSGILYILYPYSQLETLRDVLGGDNITDEPSQPNALWAQSLQTEIMDVAVELSGLLTKKSLSLSELVALKEGDVIPIEMPEKVSVTINGVPSYRAKFGAHKEKCAVQIFETIQR